MMNYNTQYRLFPTLHSHARTGSVLFPMMLLIGTLALVGATAYTVVSTDVKVSAQHKRKIESFVQAESGAQYVVGRLNQDLRSGAKTLDPPFDFNTGAGTAIDVDYSAPEGYSFDPIQELTRLPNADEFLFAVTGCSGNAITTLEAVLARENMLGTIGVFGDRDVRVQPHYRVFSYDSGELTHPSPADSTGDARVGSNEQVLLQIGVSLDGPVVLGRDEWGAPAVFIGPDDKAVEQRDRIPPDPLGAIGGELAQSFAFYSQPLNNQNASAGISNNSVSLSPHETMTLASGKYYLDDVWLGSGSTLIIDASADDPCVIYLTGSFRVQPNSTIASTDGSPRSFYLFSNSTDEIRIQPNGDVSMFLYAPIAPVRMQPNGSCYGAIWASTVEFQPNGDYYVDTRSVADWVSKTVKLVQWKQMH